MGSQTPDPPFDCFFNVYKPSGPTSHDVVAWLRRASKVRRIGHAGTLDPMAEGVLVIASGKATRLIEYLIDADKAYAAEVTLGVSTDTYDGQGRVTDEQSAAHLTRDVVEQALAGFRGEISQHPPAFSAVSVGGQRLYALARRGETVVAPARTIRITRLDLVAWSPPRVDLHVECSKGTYIRSLAHDLGQALGCGAHLSALVRLRVGRFLAHNATPLEELQARLREGRWHDVAAAADAAVAHLVAVHLDAPAVARIVTGRPVPAEGTIEGTIDKPEALEAVGRAGGETAPEGHSDPASGTLGRAYAPDGRLVAIVRLERGGELPVWRPEKVLSG